MMTEHTVCSLQHNLETVPVFSQLHIFITDKGGEQNTAHETADILKLNYRLIMISCELCEKLDFGKGEGTQVNMHV